MMEVEVEEGVKEGVEGVDGVDSLLGSLSRGDFNGSLRDLNPCIQNTHHQANTMIKGTLGL